MKSIILLSIAIFTLFNTSGQDVQAILKEYNNAWRTDKMQINGRLTIGFEVGVEPKIEKYHIQIDSTGISSLLEGIPDAYTFKYKTNLENLKKLANGEINSLTAQVKTRANDPSPVEPIFNPSLKFTPQVLSSFLQFSFHYWNKEWPERITFSKEKSRLVHGANAVVFYYQPGMRAIWFQLDPNMHVNKERDVQKNEFITLVAITQGSGSAYFGDTLISIKAGELYFIQPGMRHEIITKDKQKVQGIMIAFGKGA